MGQLSMSVGCCLGLLIMQLLCTCLQEWMREPHDVANLTLARSPIRTLYYFSCSVISGTASAAHFVATHPVNLWIALPLVAFYVIAKGLGYAPSTTEAMEVSSKAWGVDQHVGSINGRH